MSQYRPRSTSKCKNKTNHNCSPCPYCDKAEHDLDRHGRCKICNDYDTDDRYEQHISNLGGGGVERIKGRIIRKFTDDE